MNRPTDPKVAQELYAEKLRGAAADQAMGRGSGNTNLMARLLPLLLVAAVLAAVVVLCVLSTR